MEVEHSELLIYMNEKFQTICNDLLKSMFVLLGLMICERPNNWYLIISRFWKGRGGAGTFSEFRRGAQMPVYGILPSLKTLFGINMCLSFL